MNATAPASPGVESVESGDSSAGLRRAIAVLARRHGFAAGVYMHLDDSLLQAVGSSSRGLAARPRRIVSSGGLDEQLYIARNYLRLDPLVARALDDLTLFDWTLAGLAKAHPHCAPLLRSMEDWSMRAGVVAPIKDHAEGHALLNLFRPNGAPVGDHDPGPLLLEAFRLHAAAKIALADASPTWRQASLTARETDVLRMAALGHTEQDTAVLLTLSRRGVQFHLARAVEKLGAANKIAAVARAVSAGFISP